MSEKIKYCQDKLMGLRSCDGCVDLECPLIEKDNNKKFTTPEINPIKFGSEDITPASHDPFAEDPFDD